METAPAEPHGPFVFISYSRADQDYVTDLIKHLDDHGIPAWIDKDTNNVLKQQEHALSDRLMRTSYYPKWNKVFSESKGADIYFPKEIRIYDEVEKDRQSTIVMRKIDLRVLTSSIFTKAWLESKSR